MLSQTEIEQLVSDYPSGVVRDAFIKGFTVCQQSQVSEAISQYTMQKQGEVEDFQDRVKPWMLECFGEEIAEDVKERNHRFIEESLELVQSMGCTKEDVIMLVDYTYNRPAGEPYQEVGGVMVTLAALCLASGLNMHENAETELQRIWTKVDKIREKQQNKPRNSPLPILTTCQATNTQEGVKLPTNDDIADWMEELYDRSYIGSMQRIAFTQYYNRILLSQLAAPPTELKELKYITDEDAIEVAKILKVGLSEDVNRDDCMDFTGFSFYLTEVFEPNSEIRDFTADKLLLAIDYLRSRNYKL